jgi:UDPglucose 6-dehydrogenase
VHTTMNVAVIGTGYVGLVAATCLAHFGYTVTAIDQDLAKITALRQGHVPIYEPGLEQLLAHNARRLRFTTDMGEIGRVQLVIVAVGTPMTPTGAADLTYLKQAIHQAIPFLAPHAVIMIKSTIPIGTCRSLAAAVQQQHATAQIIFNPEFLREGSAIDDFLHPDRIVLGGHNESALQRASTLYQSLVAQGVPCLLTDWETAETIKYAANSFLATKITFINQLADLCRKTGARIKDVAHGMGLDKRIGELFLNPGPGYGGSCFPKDTQALYHTAHTLGVNLDLISTVIAANKQRPYNLINELAASIGDLKHKTIAVLGLAFKANTDDTRESPSLALIQALCDQGAHVRAYDPAVSSLDAFPQVAHCASSIEALTGAHGAVIATEWLQFRDLPWANIYHVMQPEPWIADFRNLLSPLTLENLGFYYIGLGQPTQSRIAHQAVA